MCNNAFVNTAVRVGSANEGKYHVLSNNGWWGSTYNSTTTFPGDDNVTTNPSLDAQNNVTSEDYRDSGIIEIAPVRPDKNMPAVSMVADETDPLYLGMCPISENEYGDGYIPNVLPIATIDEITPNPAAGSSYLLKDSADQTNPSLRMNDQIYAAFFSS